MPRWLAATITALGLGLLVARGALERETRLAQELADLVDDGAFG